MLITFPFGISLKKIVDIHLIDIYLIRYGYCFNKKVTFGNVKVSFDVKEKGRKHLLWISTDFLNKKP